MPDNESYAQYERYKRLAVKCAHLVNALPRSIAFTCRDAADKEDDRRRYQQRHDDKRRDGKRRFVQAVVPP